MVYFAFDDALNGKYIYKVEVNAGGCGNILDTDYGNRLGAWYWNAIVGMSVDPKTGDLYVAERLTTTSSVVKVIRNDGAETLQTVKTGFNNVFGVDAWREPGSDYGVLMIADFAAGQFWTVPLDNPTVASELLATGTTARLTVQDLLMNRSDVHHVYPRNHLKKQGLSRSRYNQIANFVLAQSEINIAIGAKAPDIYFKELAEQCALGLAEVELLLVGLLEVQEHLHQVEEDPRDQRVGEDLEIRGESVLERDHRRPDTLSCLVDDGANRLPPR